MKKPYNWLKLIKSINFYKFNATLKKDLYNIFNYNKSLFIIITLS